MKQTMGRHKGSAPEMIGAPLAYLREGFASCIILLSEDGTIANGPGHAEVHWSWDQETLVFRDAESQITGRLDKQDGFYAGMILEGIPVSLRPLNWPCGYRFGGPLGKRLISIRGSKPMRFLLGIPFVNRRDLLERAVASVPAMHDRLVIIDNSGYRELRNRKAITNEIVYEPPVPLTFVQSMNLLQQMAHEARCDVLCFMHNDAEAEPGMDLRFRECVENEWRSNPKFGVLFTHYDTLSAINMTAIRKIGPWDNLFSGYFADREYYARLRRYGFEEIQTDIRVIHHGSMTIKTDSRLGDANSILFPAYERIFRELCG
ncbi:MAG TPA: hypothetical protein VGF39_00820 [Stellaceae bacterium]